MMLVRQLPSFKTFQSVYRLQPSRSITQRTKSSRHRTKVLETSKSTESKLTLDAKRSDVLSRTRVVTEEKECAKIVKSILSFGEPVAVDMEV